MKTLLLDTTEWDLCLDADGNIAIAGEPYAIAQDVASAIKTFSGELYFDTAQGIPYFSKILGSRPSLQLVKAHMERAALTVPGVVTATCTFSAFQNRKLSGQVKVTDNTGVVSNVNF